MTFSNLPKGYILTSQDPHKCAECDFTINPGDPMVLDEAGWVHALCERNPA